MSRFDAQITAALSSAAQLKAGILSDAQLRGSLAEAAEHLVQVLGTGGKVLLCGNGGSAADAQHIAAELSGRFYKDRDPLFAEALHVNPSALTAVANDYGFEEVFARQCRAMGRNGDVLIAISTSGNSENVLRAVHAARDIGMLVVGMTGDSGGKMRTLCDVLLDVPSNDTPRIQEVHILFGHILCELVESALFPGA